MNAATLTIINSTLANNQADNSGGGIENDGTLTISNSTVSDNLANKYDYIATTAALYGGGIDNSSGGTVTLLSTIVAGNTDYYGPDIYGPINSLGHNLVGDPTNATGFVASDQQNANPSLGALQDNGGPTQTMAITSSSPAFGKGDCGGSTTVIPNIAAVTIDQRGVRRKIAGIGCDAGAYEVAGLDTIGIDHRNTFLLRLHNSAGSADITAALNVPGTNLPIVGDWTNSGFDSIGVYNQANGVFSLRNSNTSGGAQKSLTFGNPNDTPLSGRWTAGAANDGIGVYRPSNGILYAKNALATGYSDFSLVLGNPGDQGIAGDWTGIGQDGLGVFRPGNLNFYLVNRVLGNGIVYSDENFQFGGAFDIAIAGDWIGQGHDGVGVFRPSNATVYLKNALTIGNPDTAFLYGTSTDLPIAGHWQVTYPSVATNTPAPILIAKTATPAPNGGSVPGGNQIGG